MKRSNSIFQLMRGEPIMFTANSEPLPLARKPTLCRVSPSITRSQAAYSSLPAPRRKLSQSGMRMSMLCTREGSKKLS